MDSTLITGQDGSWLDSKYLRRGMAFLAMLAAAFACRGNYLGDWDSWDYTSQAVARHSSDLCLGRWWFIAIMRAIYLPCHAIWNLTPLQAHIPMQIACAVMMSAACPLLMAWTGRLTGSNRAELIAGLLAVAAPMVAIYSSAVMTESLACLCLVGAFYAWQRAVDGKTDDQTAAGAPTYTRKLPSLRPICWAIAAGMAFGIAVDVREPLLIMGIWPALSLLVYKPRKSLYLLLFAIIGVAATMVIGVLMAWAWYPWDTGFLHNLQRWRDYMADRRATVSWSLLLNTGSLMDFSYVAAPAAAVLAVPATVWSAFKSRKLLLLALSCLPYALYLVINHDLSVNPRYVLPMMFMLCPVAAGFLTWFAEKNYTRQTERTVWISAAIVGLAAAVALIRAEFYFSYYYTHVETRGRLCRDLKELPDGITLVAGQGLPVAYYLNRLGITHSNPITFGVGYKYSSIQDAVNAELAEGKSVYLTLHPEDWAGNTDPGGQLDQLQKIAKRCIIEHVAGSFVKIRLPAIPPATSPDGE